MKQKPHTRYFTHSLKDSHENQNHYMAVDIFMGHTKFSNIYNILDLKRTRKHGKHTPFVQLKDIREALHVGETEYADGGRVLDGMSLDRMQSVRPWLEEVLDHYRVLYYSGQLDIVVAYPLSVNMYQKLQFGAAQEYRKNKRVPWSVGGVLAGYVKSGGNFTEVLVRNAGHMVTVDQPEWALDLVTKFTRDEFRYPYGYTCDMWCTSV